MDQQDLMLRFEMMALQDDYVSTIDSDRLEDWPKMFVEDCLYEIIPKENVDSGFPAPVIYCDNAAMLRDRVVSLRNANIYNLQCYKHFLSAFKVIKREEDAVEFVSNYLVINTTGEGHSIIYQAGTYHDRAVRHEGDWKFKSKRAVYDTSRVQTLLAYPI